MGHLWGGIGHLASVVSVGVPLLVTGCVMVAFAGGMLVGWAVRTSGASRRK